MVQARPQLLITTPLLVFAEVFSSDFAFLRERYGQRQSSHPGDRGLTPHCGFIREVAAGGEEPVHTLLPSPTSAKRSP